MDREMEAISLVCRINYVCFISPGCRFHIISDDLRGEREKTALIEVATTPLRPSNG